MRYTGYDKAAAGKRPGVERFIECCSFLTGNGLWNNGSWTVRNMRGKTKPSVHSTGRAVDLSWRRMANGRGFGSYGEALAFMEEI
jgi:hypothetical protein